MDEVNGTKGASDEGKYPSALEVDLRVNAAMRKHLVVPKLPQRKLAVIAVSREVLQGMKRLT